jgi:hypothetical protein
MSNVMTLLYIPGTDLEVYKSTEEIAQEFRGAKMSDKDSSEMQALQAQKDAWEAQKKQMEARMKPWLEKTYILTFNKEESIFKEDEKLHSPLGVLFIERYSDIRKLEAQFTKLKDQIQCIVGKGYLAFGNAQCPRLIDYADDVNTLDFLAHLNRN